MNKISFPRKDVDGKEYDQANLEHWYIAENPILSQIDNRLRNNIDAKNAAEKRLLKHLQDYLPQILLMTPARMQHYTVVIGKAFGNILVHSPNGKRTSTTFGEQLLDAFNYKNYRNSVLAKLAKKLNVKTCTYCNMNYTLYAEAKHPGKRKKELVERFAKLQLDHFYDKMSFPMLSMSLYNLIPSCPVCNQGKSAHALPVIFHPYANDIHSLFSFEVVDPLPGYEGAEVADHVDVKLKWIPSVTAKERKEFEDTFHLEAMYSRHGDIVRETYHKAFESPYYTNPANFTFLSNKDAKYLEQLWFGSYMDSKDIQKRPLAKFIQDIKKQAEISRLKLRGLME